jgi:hypothetical protein
VTEYGTKSSAVRRILDDPDWAAWSDGQIAQRLGCARTLVTHLRTPAAVGARIYVTRWGTQSTMNIARIRDRNKTGVPA